MPGGTLSKVNVPSAPDFVSRRSSSSRTVAPGIGSPDSELTNRPVKGATACAAAFTLSVNATASSAHAPARERTCMVVSSEKGVVGLQSDGWSDRRCAERRLRGRNDRRQGHDEDVMVGAAL